MSRIESGLHNLHAQSREGVGVSDPSDLVHGAAALSVSPPECFAAVDLVSPGSPAEAAGLQVGDRVAVFGSVRASNFSGLKDIGQVMSKPRNSQTFVTFLAFPRSSRTVLASPCP